MNTKQDKSTLHSVRWKPIEEAPPLGTLIVRRKDGRSQLAMRNDEEWFDPVSDVLVSKDDLVSFILLSDLNDGSCADKSILKPEDFDVLDCRACSTETKPKSVSVSASNKVSVSYKCPFCDSSWRINDAGEETHFRRGKKKLIGA